MSSWQEIKLKDALNYIQPTNYIVENAQYDDSYETPVLTPGASFLLGYTNENSGIFEDVPTIIFDDFTTAFKYVDFPFKVKSSAMKILEVTSADYNIKFLYYLMQTLKFDAHQHKRYWISKYSQQKVKVPLLAEQQQVAAILDAADSLRQKDQQLVEHYTTLSQSLFLDMFGDPVTNPMGWERNEFGNNINVLTDYHANGSYEVLKKNVELKNEKDYALMVRTTDLENNNFRNNVIHISQDAYEYLEKSKVYGGEIIISKIGSAGKVFLMPKLDKPVSLGMNTFLLRFNKSLNNIFAYYLLTSKFGEIEMGKRIKGAVTKTIRKDAIREISIIVPPITLQNQFAERIAIIEQQKQQAHANLEKSEALFNSLLQRAFNGELTGSKAA